MSFKKRKLMANPYQKFRMPKGRLAETVARYNGFVEKGHDDDFEKPKLKRKIEKGPFYAAWCTVCTHDTYAGLRINGKCQVVDLAGKVIPGLYCGGESAGSAAGMGRLLHCGLRSSAVKSSRADDPSCFRPLRLTPAEPEG